MKTGGGFETAGRLCAVVAFVLFCSVALSAEPEKPAKSIPPAAGPGPANALGSFRLEAGFRLELAVAEPLVTAPVAMAFDENGRLFVVEMRDYPDRREASPHLGRVRVLENPDEKGLFQSSAIYAENLPLPSALACYAGGVFVAATPDIIYCKDTNSDGSADVSQVVLSGFGGTNIPGPRTVLNNFNWGLDNRIHGATAGIDGIIKAPTWPGGPASLADSDFSFDPRTLEVVPEAGPAQSGLCFDNWGHKYVCDFTHPLRLPMYEPRYVNRNPYYPRPPVMLDVADPATPIFRFALQVRPTYSLAASWLTQARGVTIYRGNAFPPKYQQNVFIADPEAHVVHRMVLRDNGLTMTAERAPEEQASEFLASRDPSFRPVQVLNGPDGALYIADFQADTEHGRIYRIVPENFKQPKPPQLGKAKTYDLASSLASNNGWHGDTAARLLFERHDSSAAALLASMANQASLPLARLRALHALDGLGSLTETLVLRALGDSDARVREHAVLLAERFMTDGAVSDALWAQLKTLASDGAPRVRYQLAFSIGQASRPDKPAVLADILLRDPASPWLRNAVLSSVSDGAGSFFIRLASNAQFRNDPAGYEFLRTMATMMGVRGRADDVIKVANFIGRGPFSATQIFALLYALGDGLHRTRSSLALIDPQSNLQPVYTMALAAAIDATVAEQARAEAVRLLSVSSYTLADTSDWLQVLCNPQPTLELQAAAITSLGRYDDQGAVMRLLDCWPRLTRPLRDLAFSALLSRASHIGPLLDALESKRIDLRDLSSVQLNFLRTYRDDSIRERAVRLLGPVQLRRGDVVERFKPALRIAGSPGHGRDIFLARCTQCHQLGGAGQALGPDLAGVRFKGKEFILSSIIEPSAEISRDHATCVVESKEGENLLGIRTDDNLLTLTLRLPRGLATVWPHLNVQTLQSQPWSLMPDGLEDGLAVQDLADLLEYLMTATH